MLKHGVIAGLSQSTRSSTTYICWRCQLSRVATARARATSTPGLTRLFSTYPALRQDEGAGESSGAKGDTGSDTQKAAPSKGKKKSGRQGGRKRVRSKLRKIPTVPVAAKKMVSPKLKSKSKSKAKRIARSSRPARTKEDLRDLIQRIRLRAQGSSIQELHELKEEGVPLSQLPESISIYDAMKRAPKGSKTISMQTGDVELKPIKIERKPVPELSYGLGRVLFNPGVTELRDLRSRVFNFDPYLDKLIAIKDFDFSTLGTFTTPSNDPVLADVAQKTGKKFIGSTSSMTGMLKHFHYLLSEWREPNLSMLSREFPLGKSTSFTKIQKAPDAIFLRWKNGTYAVDADKEHDSPNILSMLGKYMEKLFTVPKSVFERHRVGNSHLLSEKEKNVEDAYHYSTVDDFVVRSQLDAHDSRLPGEGMFDLKTRAVLPIRMSVRDHEWGMDYEISKHRGEFNSYEREFADMAKATMLKYSLQVRLGRMDGIFVAYHNIARVFGFQYISLDQLDQVLHGQADRTLGDQEMAFSLRILNDVFAQATQKFQQQSLRIHVETRPSSAPFMYIFVEPVSEEQVNKIQNLKKKIVEAYERRILGLEPKDDKAEPVKETSKDAEQSQQPLTDENGQSSSIEQATTESTEEASLSPNTEVTEAGGAGTDTKHGADSATASTPDAKTETPRRKAPYPFTVATSQEPSDQGSSPTQIEAGETKQKPEERSEAITSNSEDKVESPVDVKQLAQDVENLATTAAADESENSSNAKQILQEKIADSVQSGDTEFLDEVATTIKDVKDGEAGQLLGFVLRTRSFVDGKHVNRPTDLSSKQVWTLQYTLTEIENSTRARTLYEQTQRRRRALLAKGEEADDARMDDYFIEKLKRITAESKKWREELDASDAAAAAGQPNMLDSEVYMQKMKAQLGLQLQAVRSLKGFDKMLDQTQEKMRETLNGIQDSFKNMRASIDEMWAGAEKFVEQKPQDQAPEVAIRKVTSTDQRHPIDDIAASNFGKTSRHEGTSKPAVASKTAAERGREKTKSHESTSKPAAETKTAPERGKEKPKTGKPVVDTQSPAQDLEKGDDPIATISKSLETTHVEIYRVFSKVSNPGNAKPGDPSEGELFIKEQLRTLAGLDKEKFNITLSKSATIPEGVEKDVFIRAWSREVLTICSALKTFQHRFESGDITKRKAFAELGAFFHSKNGQLFKAPMPRPTLADVERGQFNFGNRLQGAPPSEFAPPASRPSSEPVDEQNTTETTVPKIDSSESSPRENESKTAEEAKAEPVPVESVRASNEEPSRTTEPVVKESVPALSEEPSKTSEPEKTSEAKDGPGPKTKATATAQPSKTSQLEKMSESKDEPTSKAEITTLAQKKAWWSFWS